MMVWPDLQTPGAKKEIVMSYIPPSGQVAHNDLEQLKHQAKDLLKAARAREPEALAIFEKHSPGSDAEPVQLADAQLVIARHHGFASWPKLHEHVMRVNLKDLIDAVEAGNLGRSGELLRRRPQLANLDFAGNDERRPLHLAVLMRNEPMVRLLIEAGADAHKGIYPDREATTPLVLARDRGFHEIVSAIEEEEHLRRESMSCPNATVSPVQEELCREIRAGRSSEALAILDSDPSLARACDKDGATPLHVACESALVPVIDRLLEHSANVRKTDLEGWTPLDRAVFGAYWKARDRAALFPEIARKLIRRGAEVTPVAAAALGDVARLRGLHASGPAPAGNLYPWGKLGLLSAAVTFGRHECLAALLDLGFDPGEPQRLSSLETEEYSRGGPLWLAAAFGEYEMARTLMDRGANPCECVYASGTPVDRAYGTRDERMKALLAEYGGRAQPATMGYYRDVDAARALLATRPDEQTVSDLLRAAACGGSPGIVTMCLNQLPWERDDERWHGAIAQPLSLWNHGPISEHPEAYDRSTYPECLRLILSRGVNINSTGKFGGGLLHRIASSGKTWGIEVMTTEERLQFARIALSFSPDLSLRDDLLKSTPLGWACRWGRKELVRLLVEHGASVHEPEAEPWATPLAWADKMGHHEISACLRTCGAVN